MTKWVIKKNDFGKLEVWEYIDNEEEARKYCYISQAIDKYGLENVVPLAMNPYGGYHSLKYDIEHGNIVNIIESEEEPKLELWQEYEVNNENFHYGWVSPDCITYGCNYMGHTSLAIRICETFYNKIGNLADDWLLEHGWVKVDNQGWLGYLWKMNDKQVKWLEQNSIKCVV